MGYGLNQFAYASDCPGVCLDPSGTVEFTAAVTEDAERVSRNPVLSSKTAGSYKFTFQGGDPATLAQHVTVKAHLFVYTARGFAHGVRATEDYLEAWISGNLSYQNKGHSFRDTHSLAPRRFAIFLQDRLKARFHPEPNDQLSLIYRDGSKECIDAWEFTCAANFEMRNGLYPRWRRARRGNIDDVWSSPETYHFKVTQLLKNSIAIPIPNNTRPLDHILGRSEQNGVPAFPPPIQNATAFYGRPSAHSNDKWEYTWESGEPKALASYRGQYVAQ